MLVHLSCIFYHADTNEIWLPPEVTKTDEGCMVPSNAQGAYQTYQRLVYCIGRESPLTDTFMSAGGALNKLLAKLRVAVAMNTSSSVFTLLVALR